MATTILEQIIARIVTAIEGVTIANGYQVDVNSVYRPATLGGQDRDTPTSYDVQLTIGTPQRAEEYDLLGNPAIYGWILPIELDCLYRPSSSNSTAIESYLNTFWADVTRAIMADPQWNLLAVDSDLGDPEYWIDMEDGTCGATGVLQVTYRVKSNDPYTRITAAPAYTQIINGGTSATADYDVIIGDA